MIVSLFLLMLLVEAPTRISGGPIMVKFSSDGKIEPMDESEPIRDDELNALALRSTPKPPLATTSSDRNIFADEGRAFLKRSKLQAEEAIRKNRQQYEFKDEPAASDERLCPICKDDLDTEEVVETQCNHSFHKSCIAETRRVANVVSNLEATNHELLYTFSNLLIFPHLEF